MGRYEKTVWIDAVVSDRGEVIIPGTLVTAERMNHIEQGIAEAAEEIGRIDMDFGTFEDNEIAQHDSTPSAHQNLVIDGNAITTASIDQTLEEHRNNAEAHPNLNVDGNSN